MPKAKQKRKPAKRMQPLTIAVHGEGIDIDMNFDAPGSLPQELLESLRRFGSRLSTDADGGAAAADADARANAMFGEFMSTLSVEQLEAIKSHLTDVQVEMLIGIGAAPFDPTHGKDHDFDVMQRIIKYSDLSVVQAFMELAKERISTHDQAS